MTVLNPTLRSERAGDDRARRTAPIRAGFTLLEVLLALGLSIAVITAIGYAIFYHLQVLDRQRQRIEQSLVARGMLNLMANDIRAAVQYKPVDVSQLEASPSSVDLTTLLASDAGADMLASAIDGGADVLSMGTDALADGAMEALVTEGEEGPRPGLYGSSMELEVDISRMPRRDQYLYGLQTTENDYASDLRTVYYRLVPTESLDASVTGQATSVASGASLAAGSGTGMSLVRSTISQAVRRYEETSGSSSPSLGTVEILADEVTSLQFRYFDATEGAWLEEWDTDEMQSLPTAVEILVEFQFKPVGAADSTAAMDQAFTDSYRLVVHLPLAEPLDEEAAPGDSGTADPAMSGGDDTGGER